MRRIAIIKKAVASLSLSLALVIGSVVPALALVPETGTSPSILTTKLGTIGDSISVGFNAGGSTYNWSTGSNVAVNSIRQRIAEAKSTAVTNIATYNAAVAGRQSSDLVRQANDVVASGANAVTILMGGNDVCLASTVGGITPAATFQDRAEDALGILDAAGVKTVVASVPSMQALLNAGKDSSSARNAWDTYNICQVMLANPLSTNQTDIDRRAAVETRVQEFNDALETECDALDNCSYDNDSVYNTAFTLSDLTTVDYFHPSVSGQNKIAAAVWPAYQAIFPNVFNILGDTTAPSVTLTAPTASSTISGTTNLTATASDAVGVTGVDFYRGTTLLGAGTLSSGVWSYSYNTTSTSNGSYSFSAKARDAANNVGTSSSVSATINNNDTTAPTVTITSPSSGTTVNNSVTLKATASDNIGVSSVKFYSGANLLGTAALVNGEYILVYNSTSLPNGTYPVVAKAKDAANNEGTSASINLTVAHATDTTAPTATVTAPTNNSTVSGTVTLSATASDNVGVTSVRFYSGVDLLGYATLNSGVWSMTFDTVAAGLTDGNYPLTAKAYDAAGNVGTSSSITVTLSNNTDYTAPTVSVTSPADNSQVSGSLVLEAEAADAVGVTSVQFFVDGNSAGYGTKSDVTGRWVLSTSTGSLSEGAHTVYAIAKDAANNSTQSATNDFTVSNDCEEDQVPGSNIWIMVPCITTQISGIVTVIAQEDLSETIGSMRVYSDPVGGSSFQFLIGFATYNSGANRWEFVYDTSNDINGDYDIVIKTYDTNDDLIEASEPTRITLYNEV